MNDINEILRKLFNEQRNKNNNLLSELLTKQRRIFISYHHDLDQYYYDKLSSITNAFHYIKDNSLDRKIDSNNPEYVMQRIRDKYITGTSCTIVLCGKETFKRKYVDWEIKATLDKEHGLIGIILPSFSYFPFRLFLNIMSNYSPTIHWNEIVNNPFKLKEIIEIAKKKNKFLIKNNNVLQKENL